MRREKEKYRKYLTHNRSSMNQKQYKISFSTGGLFRREAIALAQLFLNLGDWQLVKEKALSTNMLQTRTQASSTRLIREVLCRLKTLRLEELQVLTQGNSQEQGQILWLTVCRTYPFIADFAIEVLRENALTMNTELLAEDFEYFFNKKSQFHAELDTLRSSTKMKLRQVLFRMLREADLLDENNRLQATILSGRFLKALAPNHQQDIRYFPTIIPTSNG